MQLLSKTSIHLKRCLTNLMIFKSESYSISSFTVLIIISYFLSIFNFGCKKLVEVPGPSTSVNSKNVFDNDATAIAAVTGIYVKMSQSDFTSPNLFSTSRFCGLSADEFTLLGGITTSDLFYYKNSNTSADGSDFWPSCYSLIFTANSAIEGLNSSNGLTPAVKTQLLGESKFIRAFCYFYLVNLYGDVPLALTSNYKINGLLARTSKNQVWHQIIEDLTDAQNLLSNNYLDATLLNITNERIRPSKWAAAALLARTYLFCGNFSTDPNNYKHAVTEADSTLNNSSLFTLSLLNNVFLKASLGNNEAIWQLQPTLSGENTQEAIVFIIPSYGPNGQQPIYLNKNLLGAFETGDQRAVNWVGKYSDTSVTPHADYYYPYKYKINILNSPVTEFETVLRLGEQFLIRAEAKANLGDLKGAINDLNSIRNRAGLQNITPLSKSEILTAILRERQVELFSEWGHRWLDLKRTGSIDSVMSKVEPEKGGTWLSYKQLYPISRNDLKLDPNLVQNPNY